MSAAITRLNAALVGRYGIAREFGVLGMAKVYLTEALEPAAREVPKPWFPTGVRAKRMAAAETTPTLQRHCIRPPALDSPDAVLPT